MKFGIIALALLFSLSFGQSPTPSITNYQGRLTDASGNAVADGTGYEVEVRIWDASTGGTLVWGARYSGLAVKSGAFSLLVGSPAGVSIPGATTTDLSLAFASSSRYLGITVTKNAQGAAVASPAEMMPRQQYLSAPFAFRANSASLADTSSFAQTIGDGSVTNAKIAVNAISTDRLQAGSVSQDKLADGSVAPAKLSPAFAVISEQLPSGTSPQGAIIGWQKRSLNTVEQKVGNDVSFDDTNDQIILSPGTYEIEAYVPYYSSWGPFGGYGCRHRAALRKVSNGTLFGLTAASFSDQSGSNYSSGYTGGVIALKSFVTATGAAEAYQLDHYVQDTSNRAAIGTVGQVSTYGTCGVPSFITGVPEVYSRLIIKRIK